MPNRYTAALIAALIALLALHGCDRSESPQTDTAGAAPAIGKLKSERQTFERRAKNCSENDECSSVSVTREVFEQQPALNEAILHQLLAQLQGDEQVQETTGSLEEIADAFLAEAASVEQISSARWQLSGDAERLARRGDLLTVQIRVYRYTGGAHGIPSVEWFNWDLATGERVTLPQAIREGMEQQFWELAESAHQRWLDEQTGIDAEYREIWPFQRSEDFRFDEDGMVLLYGVYALGPYALGPVQLTIPWQELRGVLREKYLPQS